jgi:hypothetical protein
VALFALLAASAIAGAQSGDVTSSGALSSGAALQGGQSAVVTTAKKTGNERLMTAGAGARGALRLCFQPGIGWQRVPVSSFGATGELSAPGTIDSSTLGGIATKNSGAGGSSQSVYTRLSGTKQAISNECPATLTNTMAPGVAIPDGIGGNQPQAMTSVRPTSMNDGAQDWLHANSLLNPASSATSQRLIMGLTTMPSGGTHVSAGTRSGVSATQVNSLKTHAYVSSIELRRMIRNAPDLQTRIKLQELQDRLAKQSHIPTGDSTENKATKEQLKNQRGNRAHSSRKSGNNDHVTDITRVPSSHTYP